MEELEYSGDFMITATISITATATSLRNLVNTAVPNKLPVGFYGGAFQIILIPSAATVVISAGAGTPGNAGVTLPQTPPTSFVAPTGNQLSVDDIFLSGAGTETVGVIIFTW
jgi:hypothetical protein